MAKIGPALKKKSIGARKGSRAKSRGKGSVPSKTGVLIIRLVLVLLVGGFAWSKLKPPPKKSAPPAVSALAPSLNLNGPAQAYPGQEFSFTFDGIKTIRGFTGWGDRPLKDKGISGGDLKIKDKIYTSGIGTQAPSEIVFALNGKVRRFSCKAGVDAQGGNVGSLSFVVLADKNKLFTGPVMNSSDDPVSINVDVTGAKELRLVVDPAGPNDWDQADWVNLKFEKR